MRLNVSARTRRAIYAGASVVTLALPATAVGIGAGPPSSHATAANPAPTSARGAVTAHPARVRTAARRGCRKLFTVAMGERAANRIYARHARVRQHELKVLGYIERCQRNPAAWGFVRGYDHGQAARWHARPLAAAHKTTDSSSGASWIGGWAIPASVVQCESGGRNLPPNSAGASGYYQIIPGTWQAYGGGRYAPSAYQATAQEQAVVASRIWAGGAGASQWVCAG
jgi:hypothetical protein